MNKELRKIRHAELALRLASQDQRLMDSLTQRPHLMNPYPSIITRLSRRSRRFRQKLAGAREETGERSGGAWAQASAPAGR